MVKALYGTSYNATVVQGTVKKNIVQPCAEIRVMNYMAICTFKIKKKWSAGSEVRIP